MPVGILSPQRHGPGVSPGDGEPPKMANVRVFGLTRGFSGDENLHASMLVVSPRSPLGTRGVCRMRKHGTLLCIVA